MAAPPSSSQVAFKREQSPCLTLPPTSVHVVPLILEKLHLQQPPQPPRAKTIIFHQQKRKADSNKKNKV